MDGPIQCGLPVETTARLLGGDVPVLALDLERVPLLLARQLGDGGERVFPGVFLKMGRVKIE